MNKLISVAYRIKTLKILRVSNAKLRQFCKRTKWLKFFEYTAAILTAISIITSSSIYAYQFGYNNFFHKTRNINIIDSIYPGYQHDYINSKLGIPILRTPIGPAYSEYIYKNGPAYYQTLVRKSDNNIVFWSVTWCGEGELSFNRNTMNSGYTIDTHNWLYVLLNKIGYSDFALNNDIGLKRLYPEYIKLRRSTFEEIFGSAELKYFVSGATSNSYARMSNYGGNPGNYLTYFIGMNDTCTTDGFYEALVTGENNPSKKSTVRINVYGESAPFMGEEVESLFFDIEDPNDSEFYLGPDRIKIRYSQ